MENKAERIRNEHKISEFHKQGYNTIRQPWKLETREIVRREHLEVRKDRSNTIDETCSKVPLVRASFKAKKPTNNNQICNLGLQSCLEINNENYDDLIGYIDPLGLFWVNNREVFDQLQERHVIEQLKISNNSIFEFNPVLQWKNDIQKAFTMITDILLFEVNKNKYNYRHQQNFVMKMLKWNYDFESDFEDYYSKVFKVSH